MEDISDYVVNGFAPAIGGVNKVIPTVPGQEDLRKRGMVEALD